MPVGNPEASAYRTRLSFDALNKKAQLSLTNQRDAKACRKLLQLQFDVLTTLSLTILVASFVWLGGTTGSASDQRSEGCGFEAY